MKVRPPQSRAAEDLPPVALWVVWAHEEAPPPGVAALDWLLLTTLSCRTPLRRASCWAMMPGGGASRFSTKCSRAAVPSSGDAWLRSIICSARSRSTA